MRTLLRSRLRTLAFAPRSAYSLAGFTMKGQKGLVVRIPATRLTRPPPECASLLRR